MTDKKIQRKAFVETPAFSTEQRNPLSEDIDVKTSLEIVEIITQEDAIVTGAVRAAKASIATAMDWASETIQTGGRIFYFGAGTSGRLGNLDASECPPTFGVSSDLFQAFIAGGDRALKQSVEGAEDDPKAGEEAVRKAKIKKGDLVIGISAGSTARYVRGALAQARKKNAKTILLTCTPLTERPDFVDLVVAVVTGPEIISGSTRMKAGTATKMVLNMISTGSMIRSGRTYGNLMVDLKCSNEKLVRRGRRIIEDVTRLPEKEAAALLEKADFDVKLALAMQVLQIGKTEARKQLKENDGFLRRLFEWPHRKNQKVAAVFFDMDGTILHYNLPNGFSTWAALGWAFGIFEEMQEWVDRYYAGDLSYNAIWETCAKRLQGEEYRKIRNVLFPCAGTPPYSRGFVDCIRVLRQHYRTGIVSSGISLVAEEVKKNLALDFEVSNFLGVREGKFDASFDVRVPFDRKLDAVKAQAKQLGISLAQLCFVGDSANDIPVLEAVGFPVAYSPKSQDVAEAARGNVIGDFLQLPKVIERL